jgi:predicted GNAT family acetyltransferase
MADPTITVRDNVDAHRFEVLVDDRVGGFAEYTRTDDRVIFTHTEIDDAYEGQGLGSQLVQEALDSVRAAGQQVVPRCPFVRGWIERHTAYSDLVAS